MFNNEKPQNPNKGVNRILTYGLLAFLVYSVYNARQLEKKAPPVPVVENMSYAQWETPTLPAPASKTSVKINNKLTGEGELIDVSTPQKLTLEINKAQLKKLEAEISANKNGKATLYEIEIIKSN